VATEREEKTEGLRTPDPTENVKDLVKEVVIRLDSLRESERRHAESLQEAERRFTESELKAVREVMELRAKHVAELRLAETARINAIREVDVNAIAIATERANTQAQVLATQVQATQEAMRSLVSTTEARLSERLMTLERLQYEGKGLSGVVPPQVVEQLAQLQESRYRNEGRSGLSTPILMMITGTVVGLLVFALQTLMGG
jgi:hypothetical protein